MRFVVQLLASQFLNILICESSREKFSTLVCSTSDYLWWMLSKGQRQTKPILSTLKPERNRQETHYFNKPVAGYLVSRLQVAFQREVYWLLDNDYLSPEDVDEAAIWGLALRMMVVGICQRIDFGGLDLSARTTTQSSQSTPVDYKPRKLLELVQEGALGVKAGRGFYDYKGRSEAEVSHDRDMRLLKLLKVLSEIDIAGPIL
jgi:3-hydroxyacyl-CoA dehydrogenase